PSSQCSVQYCRSMTGRRHRNPGIPPLRRVVTGNPSSAPCYLGTHNPGKVRDQTDTSRVFLDPRQEKTSMNPNQKGAKKNQKGLLLWGPTRALAALPDVRSVLGSFREPRLEAQHLRREAHRLADRPGRPDRAALVAHQDFLQEAQRADLRYEEAL